MFDKFSKTNLYRILKNICSLTKLQIEWRRSFPTDLYENSRALS